MVKITKLPPGEAVGARDLQTWNFRRSLSRSKTKKTVNDSATKTVEIICLKCNFRSRMEVLKKSAIKFKCRKCGSTETRTKKLW